MNICVYGASGSELDKRYFDAARELGALIAGHGHSLVFGGGSGGLMGSCALGAYENGGEIIGVAPSFFDEPGVFFPHCTRFIETQTVRERKAVMEELAGAFIAMPGGIGTLEELLEILTLKQLGQNRKPLALLNTLGYYDALVSFLRAAADGGFLGESCFGLFSLCPDPSGALERIMTPDEVAGSPRRLCDYVK